jgi:CRP/FNR family cyclic AMP-dependent transcriptional regulator
MNLLSAFDPEAFVRSAGEGRTVTVYQADQIVFAQGDRADAVYYLESGRIKVMVVSPHGKEAVVALLQSGDFFGEGCMGGQAFRVTSAVAMTECRIARLEKDVVIRTLHEQTKFAEFFIAYLLARNERIEADLVDQLFNSSEKRLARLLLILANFGKDEKPATIVPNISQETLAEMIGTTRSRVSSFMNKFRRLGLVSYNGKLIVNRELLNTVLFEHESSGSGPEET